MVCAQIPYFPFGMTASWGLITYGGSLLLDPQYYDVQQLEVRRNATYHSEIA